MVVPKKLYFVSSALFLTCSLVLYLDFFESMTWNSVSPKPYSEEGEPSIDIKTWQNYSTLSISKSQMVKFEPVNDTKYIVFWTKYIVHTYWGMGEETLTKSNPLFKNCPEHNCVFTHNKNCLKGTHEYDAVFFYTSEQWVQVPEVPPTRSPHQLYVMMTNE
jgi:hypothetical protein